jgi:serine/threonine protein kinase
MGVVYLARDLRLDRPVALKTLPCLSARDVEGIRAEARAMAALDHPQVAVLYGLEDWRGTPVLVVEYLPGGTLATRLASGPLALADALSLGVSIAEALAALHGRGWLHRDVKPSNIGFGRGGGPKLLDFGLTRWMQSPAATTGGSPAGSAEDSTAGLLAGTPLYLSPEAVDGDSPGEHDDVWALSVVLVEMITGVHPYRGATRDAIIERLRRRAPLDLRVHGRMPSEVADVLTRALHPERRRRIARAIDLASALRALDRAS